MVIFFGGQSMKRVVSVMAVLMLAACNSGDTEDEAVNEKSQQVAESETNEEAENNDSEEVETEESSEDEESSDTSEADKAQEENNDSESDIEAQNEESEEAEEAGESAEDNTEAAEEEANQETAVREFTDAEKQAMVDEFYTWAVERAEVGGMAVTKYFLTHGAAGSGDWYANTPDGEAQVQNLKNPGFDHFDMHIIGGVAFYQPSSGIVGTDNLDRVPGTAEGYSNIAVPETNIHKYILVDNGVVYELIAPKENMAFSSGFGEYADDGTKDGGIPTDKDFELSGDQDAQEEWQRILSKYQKEIML